MCFSNDDLVMPPKPNEHKKKLAFYNIDFSLEHQVSSSFRFFTYRFLLSVETEEALYS